MKFGPTAEYDGAHLPNILAVSKARKYLCWKSTWGSDCYGHQHKVTRQGNSDAAWSVTYRVGAGMQTTWSRQRCTGTCAGSNTAHCAFWACVHVQLMGPISEHGVRKRVWQQQPTCSPVQLGEGTL